MRRRRFANAVTPMLGAAWLCPVVLAQDVDFSYRSDDRQFGIGFHYDDDPYHEIDYVDVDQYGEIEIDVFRDRLSPYGHWVYRRPYGWVWQPVGVSPDWRPYTRGHWAYTDYGWTWVSEEPWGWATYHYGRWFHDPYQGWMWVPGTRWGPAWVAWRTGPDYIGWAPLPPQVRWRADVGLDVHGIDLDVHLSPTAWSFVEERSFLAPRVYSYIVPHTRNVTYLRRAPITMHYSRVGDRIVNLSVPVDRIERRIGRRIDRRPVHVVQSAPDRTVTRYDSGAVNIYRPRITINRTRDTDRSRTVRFGDRDRREDVRSRHRDVGPRDRVDRDDIRRRIDRDDAGQRLERDDVRRRVQPDRRDDVRRRAIERAPGRRPTTPNDDDARRSRTMRQREQIEREGRTVRDESRPRQVTRPPQRTRPDQDARRLDRERARQKAEPRDDED